MQHIREKQILKFMSEYITLRFQQQVSKVLKFVNLLC